MAALRKNFMINKYAKIQVTPSPKKREEQPEEYAYEVNLIRVNTEQKN